MSGEKSCSKHEDETALNAAASHFLPLVFFILMIDLIYWLNDFSFGLFVYTDAQIHISTQSLGKVWEEALVKEPNLG